MLESTSILRKRYEIKKIIQTTTMLYHRQETPNQQDIIEHQNSLLSISGKFKSGLLSSGIKPTVSGPRKPALTRPWSLLTPEGAAGYYSYKDKQKVS